MEFETKEEATPEPDHDLQIQIGEGWFPADLRTWRAWTGRRAVMGREYHGPVFYMDSDEDQWSGRRICTCPRCQGLEKPELRLN